MSNGNNGSTSSVGIVAIIAILLLVGLGAWFMFGRPGARSKSTPAQTTQPTQDNSRVDVKVDLPDTITIKP
jgi:hypothetical protein